MTGDKFVNNVRGLLDMPNGSVVDEVYTKLLEHICDMGDRLEEMAYQVKLADQALDKASVAMASAVAMVEEGRVRRRELEAQVAALKGGS